MYEIIDGHFDFLKKIRRNQHIVKKLRQRNITIQTDCEEYKDLAKRFYKTWYKPTKKKRLVLVGMIPSHRGAGKTGIPFLDFKTLSSLLDGVPRTTSEVSAQFINNIIQHFSPKIFFEHVYMTNLSWFGFKRQEIMYHYYDLARLAGDIFLKGFENEMDIIKPNCIVPLGVKVEETLVEMKQDGYLDDNIRIAKRLPHPYWCSMPQNVETGLRKYVNVIEQYIQGEIVAD